MTNLMLSPSVFKFNAIIGLGSKIAGDLHGGSGKNMVFGRSLVPASESELFGVQKLRGGSAEIDEDLPKSSR
jgi:hypothetical protein